MNEAVLNSSYPPKKSNCQTMVKKVFLIKVLSKIVKSRLECFQMKTFFLLQCKICSIYSFENKRQCDESQNCDDWNMNKESSVNFMIRVT